MRCTLRLLACCLLLGLAPAYADPGIEFFEKKVRPVLVERCYPCHSTATQKQRGGLLLDSRDGMRKGGDSGPALVPGKPEQSLLLKLVRHTADPKMPPPPRGRPADAAILKLPDAVIADLEAWVKMGAPDPRDQTSSSTAVTWEAMLKNRRSWWSLQPVQQPAFPAVKQAGWSNHPVDRFLLARLEQAGLPPAEAADRRTLIRRLSLVLTGLPPSVGEVDEFLKESEASAKRDAAIEQLVDRLLASPHFGERWARHWLDVVRFSETHGNEWNYEVHHAWRYRDYLIRAFNDDVPFDQLVREQIAGDLLPRPRWSRAGRFNESVIGTAFYRFGEVNHDDCISLRQIGFDLVDNQLDTLTKAFQATTVACARCHDHKLDAISTKDYHALLGVLRSSRQVSHTLDAPEFNAEPMQRLQDLKASIRKELGEVWLREAGEVGRYLLAAQAQPDAGALTRGLDPGRLEKWTAALRIEKPAPEDPLTPWRQLAGGDGTTWLALAERHVKDERERTAFNRTEFVSFADFRKGQLEGWQSGGMGLQPARGDFALHAEGDALVKAVLPAGRFTHALSERLNGTLRSPVLPAGKKRISFEVMGQRSSAVRLVSNNCQLNYKNYRALTSDQLHWVTFEVPDDRAELRVYAELMTMFDNPKFPDQLSSIGGDKENYRLPWEKAAADPRSYFGVTRVVLHDGIEPPRPERGHWRPLFEPTPPEADAPGSPKLLAERYTAAVTSAVRAWSADSATDEDVRWLDALLRRGLLGNTTRLTPRLEALAGQYRAVEKELALPRVAPGLADFGPGIEQPVFVRGDCTKPGETVPRRYLEVLSGAEDRFAATGSGRLELAERIASADNPLTARVFVNRVWHHLFGAGIVRTTDDFGRVGELPSHPELLDYLAARFVEDGWSMKKLIRLLVLTRTFQASSRPAPAGREVDPQNRLLAHYPARRMEAEAIRDAILTASGRLDRTLYGMSIAPYREQANADRRLFPGPLDGNGRRSIYIKNTLMEAPRFLSVFNFPGGKVAQARRDVTNVPAQALALLNDPFVLQQADVWATRLTAHPEATLATGIERMFVTALGRPPLPEERQRFERVVAQLAELHGVPLGDVLKNRAVRKDVAHTLFNLTEFIYIP